MAIALDMAAALMAGGASGTDMDEANQGSCTGCCQIFIAFDPYLFGNKEDTQAMLNKRVAAADSAHPINEKNPVSCPGERTVKTSAKNMKEGVTADETVWKEVQSLATGNLNVTDVASN